MARLPEDIERVRRRLAISGGTAAAVEGAGNILLEAIKKRLELKGKLALEDKKLQLLAKKMGYELENDKQLAQFKHDLKLLEIGARGAQDRQTASFKQEIKGTDLEIPEINFWASKRYTGAIDEDVVDSKPKKLSAGDIATILNDPTSEQAKIAYGLDASDDSTRVQEFAASVLRDYRTNVDRIISNVPYGARVNNEGLLQSTMQQVDMLASRNPLLINKLASESQLVPVDEETMALVEAHAEKSGRLPPGFIKDPETGQVMQAMNRASEYGNITQAQASARLAESVASESINNKAAQVLEEIEGMAKGKTLGSEDFDIDDNGNVVIGSHLKSAIPLGGHDKVTLSPQEVLLFEDIIKGTRNEDGSLALSKSANVINTVKQYSNLRAAGRSHEKALDEMSKSGWPAYLLAAAGGAGAGAVGGSVIPVLGTFSGGTAGMAAGLTTLNAADSAFREQLEQAVSAVQEKEQVLNNFMTEISPEVDALREVDREYISAVDPNVATVTAFGATDIDEEGF